MTTLLNNKIDFPKWFLKLLESYPGKRDIDVLTRSYLGSKSLSLFISSEEDLEHASITNTLGILINIFLDDIADIFLRDDLIELAEGYMIRNEPFDNPELNYLKEIWNKYVSLTMHAPGHEMWKSALSEQWLLLIKSLSTSIKYNRRVLPFIYNDMLKDLSPNIHFTIKMIVDLMFSENPEVIEKENLLMFSNDIQKLFRIGNWLKSWELELRQPTGPDIANGIMCLAIEFDVITIEDINNAEINKIISLIKNTKIKNLNNSTIIEHLLNEITYSIYTLKKKYIQIKNINIENYFDKITQVLKQQLNSTSERR